jgi:hypothetical protein
MQMLCGIPGPPQRFFIFCKHMFIVNKMKISQLETTHLLREEGFAPQPREKSFCGGSQLGLRHEFESWLMRLVCDCGYFI